MIRGKYNNLKQILLLASLLTVFFSLSVNAQNLPLPPDGLPQGYETWSVVYDFPNRTITMEQKLNADFWKQNLTEPIPPIWWFNEVLGRSYPESSPYDQQIADAQDRGDWATELELKQKNINELGITADEQSEVTSRWFDRNPYHNLSYFALGVTDKKTRTFMSNQNPDDPMSPFAKEGENIMVVEVLEDNVSGILELTDWDITKIGLFEKGFTLFGGKDYIRGLVEKAQKAKFFLGVSLRENGLESYSGFKVGGIFGIAFRTMDSGPSSCTGASVSSDRWKGEYYNNTSLSGTPSMVRDDGNGALNFDWGGGGPGSNCGIGTDNFSARWSRTAAFNAGTYRFTVTSDDGFRLYVDDVLKLDKWFGEAPTTYTVDVSLGAGSHTIRMEYFEFSGGATAMLSWQQIDSGPSTCTASVSTDHWKGEYYSNMFLSGSPVMVVDDGTGVLNFNWNGSAVSGTCGIGAENFSVRWTRAVNFNAGTYHFSMTVDDGGRLYIDGNLYIDRWVDQGASTYTVDIPLSAGNHTIVMEYYQHLGGTAAMLSWQQIDSGPSSCTASVSSDRWKGEYYNNTSLSGTPSMVRDDGNGALNFDWNGNAVSGTCGIGAENFSVRWTRAVNFNAGTYHFSMTVDDGGRLYIDGNLYIDRWVDQGASTYIVDIPLSAGNHHIVMEYYQHLGGTAAMLSWQQLH